MRLYTSRYQAGELIAASGLVPVRITRGHPRFRLGYELGGKLPELYPSDEAWTAEDDEAFTAAYLAQLDRTGADRIAAGLSRISRGHGGLVLLCYEPAGEFCHRRLFAEWWERKTGEVVPELDEAIATGSTIDDNQESTDEEGMTWQPKLL